MKNKKEVLSSFLNAFLMLETKLQLSQTVIYQKRFLTCGILPTIIVNLYLL